MISSPLTQSRAPHIFVAAKGMRQQLEENGNGPNSSLLLVWDKSWEKTDQQNFGVHSALPV